MSETVRCAAVRHVSFMLGMLAAEHECNWSRGLCLVQSSLLRDDLSSEEALDAATRTYRSMHGGAGSFSDVGIWREDPQERMRLNHLFGEAADELWKLLSGGT